MYDYNINKPKTPFELQIDKVIYNKPATIIYWKNGVKTVVKCQDGDEFDPEKGLVMGIIKALLGNSGNYNEELKKWLPKDDTKEEQIKTTPKKPASKELTLNLKVDSGDINRELIKALLGLPF